MCAPVATTTAVPLPEATLPLPWKHSCGCSNSSPAVVPGASTGYLATGADSPVSAAWYTVSPPARSSRTWAGDQVARPRADHIPGTSWSTGRSRSVGTASASVLRSTVAVLATKSRNAAIERSARCSPDDRGAQLTTTSTVITLAVPQEATSAETRPRQSRYGGERIPQTAQEPLEPRNGPPGGRDVLPEPGEAFVGLRLRQPRGPLSSRRSSWSAVGSPCPFPPEVP